MLKVRLDTFQICPKIVWEFLEANEFFNFDGLELKFLMAIFLSITRLNMLFIPTLPEKSTEIAKLKMVGFASNSILGHTAWKS